MNALNHFIGIFVCIATPDNSKVLYLMLAKFVLAFIHCTLGGNYLTYLEYISRH